MSKAAENCSAAALRAPPNLGPMVKRPEASEDTKSLPMKEKYNQNFFSLVKLNHWAHKNRKILLSKKLLTKSLPALAATMVLWAPETAGP